MNAILKCWIPLFNALGILAILQGCASKGPPRVKVAPTIVTPTQIADLVFHSNTEWERWGKRVVRAMPGSPTCLVQADGSCEVVAEGCGDEQTRALCPIVNTYWANVSNGKAGHSCNLNDVCEVKWPPGDTRSFEMTAAWSAAFVSTMLKKAKFSTSEFWPSGVHAEYIFAARDGYASAFEVVPIPAYPQVGDIICANRVLEPKPGEQRRRPLKPEEIFQIRANGPAMHCDIVVQVDLTSKMVHAIGGNVQQTVARTLTPLDDQGLLQYNADSGRPWMLVMRARRSSSAPQPLSGNPG
ncbi:DUF2272 domain-containing protein [Hydrogenophaga sp. Root209]|uniref:DUF2272 domain-containing protein n=1 Tax=Hydrogenophaga sp. Root209 TaxID=1736490 RepID=UPI000A6DD500|nr:DUF2272 domain-containing protein [Hydrogenophaga sp. Root209]